MHSRPSKTFIRHGEKDTLNTKIDPPLTTLGMLQALTTGRNEAQKQYQSKGEDVVFLVSPYKRTIQTAVMSLAQTQWDDNIPQLIIDRSISESITNENCYSSERDELLRWIKEDICRTLVTGIEEALIAGLITQEDKQGIIDRIHGICDNMDISEVEKEPSQKIWPQGTGEDNFETREDIYARMDKVDRKYKGKHVVLFTHSTFIADIFSRKRLIELLPKVANDAKQAVLRSSWDANTDIPLAAAFEVVQPDDNYEQIIDRFDPATLEAA